MRDMPNIPTKESAQLKIKILVFRSAERVAIFNPSRQCDTLLPARNCKDPSNPPLCISLPLIPILYKRSDPDTSLLPEPAKNLSVMKIKAGKSRLNIILYTLQKFFSPLTKEKNGRYCSFRKKEKKIIEIKNPAIKNDH